ncbi:MAG TPA: carbohydrate ABC transporter permease, partial [Limnochordia bacterium]|nr:carbohydrate ABC transporter permease [Limnochordia bacterium]
MQKMQDTLLLRMRQSGWFDVLLFLLAVAIVFMGLAAAGRIQYSVQMNNMAEGLTQFEIRQNLGSLATRYATFSNIGLITLFAVVFGLVLLAVASYYQDKVSLQTKKNLGKLRVGLQYLVAIAVTLVMLFPIYWMVISSLKTSTELLLPVPTLWPREFQWQNFPNVLRRAPFVRYLFNTLVTTFFMMIGELVIGILAAYGFAKGRFKGQNILFMLVLGALMVPIQVTFVPIYVMISRVGWINSFPGLIVPNLVSAYFIFMLRQAFRAVDESYLDAGRVDGLGRIGLIWNVLIPMTKPTLITISIITFINGWNNYFWPKMVATRDEYRTIAVGVTRLRQTFA